MYPGLDHRFQVAGGGREIQRLVIAKLCGQCGKNALPGDIHVIRSLRSCWDAEKAKNRLLARAAQKGVHVFAGTDRAATGRERWSGGLFRIEPDEAY
jgi:hypothetical protein